MTKMLKLFKQYEAVLLYLFFGVLTTIINYLVYVLCCDLFQLSAARSNIMAWTIAVLWAFLTNKPFVFKSKKWSWEIVMPEFMKFVSGRVISGVIETVFLLLTVDYLDWHGKIMKLIASGMVMILNYFFSKWIAFK